MRRKEFLKISALFGIGWPLHTTLSGCEKDHMTVDSFQGKVVIIGAGAGGLAAGYFLQRHGVEFEILEASLHYGGRMRTNYDFADFPIPLGAEWLHSHPEVFQQIVNDNSVKANVETVEYDPQADTVGFWNGRTLRVDQLVDSDRKFVDGTWFDFYDTYIVPKVRERITLNAVVQSVDYSGAQISILTEQKEYTADKVILAVPLKILQSEMMQFIPLLPDQKREDLRKAQVWDGFKAFFEFSEKFYHTATAFEINPETAGQKLYYDAAYGQNTTQNILGLFVVGAPAQPYLKRSANELRDYILQELDEIYGNAATPNYVKHLTQNWSEEPFIRGAYLVDHEDWRLVKRLSEPVLDRIFFAGGPFTDGEDWVAVEHAAASAKRAVEALMRV